MNAGDWIVTNIGMIVGWIGSLFLAWTKLNDKIATQASRDADERNKIRETLLERIRDLEVLFYRREQDRAGERLHKPDPDAHDMDIAIEKMHAQTETPAERAALMERLRQRVMGTEQDTGERALLQAMKKVDDPYDMSPAPDAPPNKPPDQTLTEHNESRKVEAAEHTGQSITGTITIEGTSTIRIKPDDDHPKKKETDKS